MMINNCVVSITMFCIITFELWQSGLAVKLNKLVVPEQVAAYSHIVLDCDYTLDEPEEEGLVVKWFYNDNMLVYQWIVGYPPVSLGILRNRVNLNYTANSNPNQRYRAIEILRIPPELTGNYTCVVSTLQSEDSQKKEMIVFEPPSSLDVEHEFIARKYEISCVARGVFPMPNLTLRVGDRIINDTTLYVIHNNNAYDVRSKAIVNIQKRQEQFTCELNIPQTTYTATKIGVVSFTDNGCNSYGANAFYLSILLFCQILNSLHGYFD